MRKSYRIEIIKAKMGKLISWVLILAFVGVLFTVVRNLQNLNKSKLRIQEAEEGLERLKKENEELIEKQKAVQSMEFRESQIRDKLGLIKEGEIIIILPDIETVKKFAPVDEPQNIENPKPYWKKWLELFV